MLNKHLVLIFSIIGMFLVSFPSFSEEDEVGDMWTPSFSVLDCEVVHAEGMPGSSRENPLKISMKELLGKSEKLSCSWVELTVFFKWDSYRSYAATFYPSQDKYNEFDLPYGDRDKIIRLENFFENKKPQYDYQNTSIKVSGLFYDLCYQQDMLVRSWPEFKEGDWIWTFGPCHYSAVRLMKDVMIIEADKSPKLFLTEAQFRTYYGDLTVFPENSAYLNEIRRVSLEWLSYIQKGDFEDLLETFKFSDKEKKDATEDAKLNLRAFYEEFFQNKENYLTKGRKSLENVETRIFATRYRNKNNENVVIEETAISCFCLDETCSDFDPIFEREMETYDPPNLCVWLEKVEKENGEVKWIWWEEQEDEEEQEE